MSKYEIMMLVDPSLSHDKAVDSIANLTTLFNNNNCSEHSVSWSWSDKLAYPIKKKEFAHRLLINFTTDDKSAIAEFNRLVIINKAVLRHLLINVERNYGYKNLVNPKKIKLSEYRNEKYLQYIKNKEKQAQQLSLTDIEESKVTEAKMRKVRDYKLADNKGEDNQ